MLNLTARVGSEMTPLSQRASQKFQGFSRRNFREGDPNKSKIPSVLKKTNGLTPASPSLILPGLPPSKSVSPSRGETDHVMSSLTLNDPRSSL